MICGENHLIGINAETESRFLSLLQSKNIEAPTSISTSRVAAYLHFMKRYSIRFIEICMRRTLSKEIVMLLARIVGRKMR